MIRNLTKKSIIVEDYEEPSSLTGKIRGMIGGNMRCMVFTTRFGIHTFLMSKTIDVMVVDNNKKVVSIRKNLSPNQLYFWNPRYRKVIELDAGLVKKSHTEIGDELEL